MSIGIIVLLTLLVAAAVAGIVMAVKAFIDLNSESEEYELSDEPLAEPVAIGARVISRQMDMRRDGSIKIPHHTRVFTVTFLTDDGKTVEYAVPEDLFEYCIPYTTGTLVTLNGEFYYFGEGEDVE